jgi:hypothetical protein
MTQVLERAMQLQEWANTHQPAETLMYKNGYWDQIIFVRDNIAGLLAKTYEEYKEIRAGLKVISEHTSKSVCLPVFRVELVDGTMFTMRYNFYDWKVSVSSPRDVEANFMDIFNPNLKIQPIYCEGFPQDLVYGTYAENKRQFTIELLSSNYRLFMFFWIFAHQVLGNRNMEGRAA